MNDIIIGDNAIKYQKILFFHIKNFLKRFSNPVFPSIKNVTIIADMVGIKAPIIKPEIIKGWLNGNLRNIPISAMDHMKVKVIIKYDIKGYFLIIFTPWYNI